MARMGDRREKLEHGRRMRGGREETCQTAAKKSEVQGGKKRGTGDRREKLERGRRRRGGRGETRQTAAKKSEEQGGKRKEVRETGAKS